MSNFRMFLILLAWIIGTQVLCAVMDIRLNKIIGEIAEIREMVETMKGEGK